MPENDCDHAGIPRTATEPHRAGLPGLEAILDSLPFYVLLIDEDHTIIHANKAVTATLGKSPEEIIGQYCPRVIHGLDGPFPNCPLEEYLETGSVKEKELYNESTDTWYRSVVYPVDPATESGKRLFVHMIHDITQLKRTEEDLRASREQLLTAQKTDTLGKMARGIVHDFNNMLTAILGFSEMAMESIGTREDIESDIQSIIGVSRQAYGLTQQLLSYSKGEVHEATGFCVNEICGGLRELLGYMVTGNIRLVMNLHPERTQIFGVSSQIEQLILNLAVNARDAMPEGGTVTVSTDLVSYTDEDCPALPDARPGNFVCLSVRDTGTGMDRETLDRIFTPYFTTKGERGTGLGLATVHDIVKQHGGWIEVTSEPGEGTEFRVNIEELSKVPVNYQI